MKDAKELAASGQDPQKFVVKLSFSLCEETGKQFEKATDVFFVRKASDANEVVELLYQALLSQLKQGETK